MWKLYQEWGPRNFVHKNARSCFLEVNEWTGAGLQRKLARSLGVWSQLLIALYLTWYYYSFYCVYCFFLLFYTNDNPLYEFICTFCYSCLTSPLSTHLLIYFWHSFLSVCKAVPHSFCGCIMPEWIIIYLSSPHVLLVQVIM